MKLFSTCLRSCLIKFAVDSGTFVSVMVFVEVMTCGDEDSEDAFDMVDDVSVAVSSDAVMSSMAESSPLKTISVRNLLIC